MKIVVGILVFICGLVGGFICNSRIETLTGTPLRSYSSIADLPEGQLVVAYGGVLPKDPVLDLALYIREVYVCTTHTDSKGKSHTDCNWRQADRHTPPFELVSTNQTSMLQIVNDDYNVTGDNRYVSEGLLSGYRKRGFQQGDGVLVLGQSSHGSIVASEVFGGTLTDYIFGLRIWMWAFFGIGTFVLIASITITVADL